MKYLTLKDIKNQCVINEEYTDEDDYLEALGDTAEEIVERQINQSLDDVYAIYEKMPMPLVHAMKMMVEYLYSNRGGEDNKIPDAFYHMCHLFKSYKNTYN